MQQPQPTPKPYAEMKRVELINLCRQTVEGFKESMARKTKKELLGILMPDTLPPVEAEDDVLWKPYKKQDLVRMASAHPDYKKSMDRQKKEDLVRFLRERGFQPPTNTKPIDASEAPAPNNSSEPLKPKAKKPNPQRLTKTQLMALCNERADFDLKEHGKTRAAMIAFLQTPPPSPLEALCGGGGTVSPVNIGMLLDQPENIQKVRAALLRLLMDKEPFRMDPDLEAKLDKIV